jgi:hypothetical protein
MAETAAPYRWRVDDGEEARLTPGAAAAAEVWSRGFLPLRARSEGSYRLRAAFPGTAVVLGAATYEVLSETELPEAGLFVYRMRPWPEGEVVRDRVVYGPAFVRAVRAERALARGRARARPYRFLLYPLVGFLPEEEQVRLADRLGLYAVTATLTSALVEGLALLLVPVLLARHGAASAIVGVSAAGFFSLLALPAFGRAFSAFFLRETGGSAPVVLAYEALRALGVRFARHDRSVVPLTRPAFWERLARPDTVSRDGDGSLVYHGLLPHLTWGGVRNIRAGNDYWRATEEPARLERGRLVYRYRLTPAGEPSPGAPALTPPSASAYADEVMDGVRREWDDWNAGFAWITGLLSEELQARAFDHRGGPAGARRATQWTAGSSVLAGLYLLSFLPGPPGDPLGPIVFVLAAALIVDGARRLRAAGRGLYAPSLLRVLVPADLLRPERVAYHAHRDAERRSLDAIARRGGSMD